MTTTTIGNPTFGSNSFRRKPQAAALPRIGWLKRFQIAQMQRALEMLNGTQLAQIGISRADIPDTARRMILNG